MGSAEMSLAPPKASRPTPQKGETERGTRTLRGGGVVEAQRGHGSNKILNCFHKAHVVFFLGTTGNQSGEPREDNKVQASELRTRREWKFSEWYTKER